MCLSTIKERYEGDGIGPIIAYKEFRLTDGQILNSVRPGKKPWIIGRERSASPRSKPITNSWKKFSYPAGFHAFARKGDPGVRILAQVQLRGVHTYGKQGGRLAYVARYCKILKIVSQ